jgi:uncharacterized protein
MRLVIGLITGVLFGFLLQKGRVLRFEKQINAMRLKDMTIFKFMLSAIVVGLIGILAMHQTGYISLSHKPMNLGALLIGGVLFGSGWALMGFCPGTSVGALGEGRWHGLFAIVGMIAGAALFTRLFPLFKRTVLAWKDFGKIGLHDALGVSPWLVAGALIAASLALFVWFEKSSFHTD